LVNNLNDVVWSFNQKNDSVTQVMERLKEYAFTMTQAKSIHVNWKVENSIRDIKLPMEYLKNIYLICKEAINNSVKYAGCHEIIIAGGQINGHLVFSICDDGKGFDPDNEFNGNGLKNMRDRAGENKMKIEIKSSQEQGTAIHVYYQITQ
jgi:signal transduction histidine kinase